jgi:hypothetical protein
VELLGQQFVGLRVDRLAALGENLGEGGDPLAAFTASSACSGVIGRSFVMVVFSFWEEFVYGQVECVCEPAGGGQVRHAAEALGRQDRGDRHA